MNMSAIVMMFIACFGLWGGFAVCATIMAMSNKFADQAKDENK